jgi:hypothetical protein
MGGEEDEIEMKLLCMAGTQYLGSNQKLEVTPLANARVAPQL